MNGIIFSGGLSVRRLPDNHAVMGSLRVMALGRPVAHVTPSTISLRWL